MPMNPNDSSPPPLPPGIPGKSVAVAIFVLLSLIALFTYYAVPQFVVPYFRAKPALAEASFDNLEAALRRYAADHGGALPPEELIINHRRHNKNVLRARALGMMTLRASVLTTPVAYIEERDWGDPYALPEQFVPPAYQVFDFPEEGERWALLASPGPNLRHDVRTVELRSISGMEELLAYLEENTWRGEDGGNRGDLVRVVRIPLSEAGRAEE